MELGELEQKLIYILGLAGHARDRLVLGTPCRVYDGRLAYISVTTRRSSPHICLDQADAFTVTVAHNMLRCLPSFIKPVMVYVHVRRWPEIPKPGGLTGRIKSFLWKRRLAGAVRSVESLSRHLIPALTLAVSYASKSEGNPVIVKDGDPGVLGDIAYCFNVYAIYLSLETGHILFAGSRY